MDQGAGDIDRSRTSGPHEPRIVSWDRAVDAVLTAAAAARSPQFSSALIGVTGPVGSGKTTLARRLASCIVSTDDYLPDYDKVQADLRDQPELADLPALARDLIALRAGRSARIPVWSFQTHRRESYRDALPEPVVVCEGIHALHHSLAPLFDLRVYVEASPAARWARWEELERTGQRGWGVEEARRFFHNVAEPTYARFAPTYRRTAHIVVLNEGHDAPEGE